MRLVNFAIELQKLCKVSDSLEQDYVSHMHPKVRYSVFCTHLLCHHGAKSVVCNE
jgi:hypothetical protein